MFRKSGCWHINYPIRVYQSFRAQILESFFLAQLLLHSTVNLSANVFSCISKYVWSKSKHFLSLTVSIFVCWFNHQSSPERIPAFTLVVYSSHSHIASPKNKVRSCQFHEVLRLLHFSFRMILKVLNKAMSSAGLYLSVLFDLIF